MEKQSANKYFVHSSACIDTGAEIGNRTKVWHFCHIMSKAKIGNDCSLGQNVFIADDVHIGDNVKIQNNVSLYTGVMCEDNVFIGPSAVFTNVKNPRSEVVRRSEYRKTILRKGVSIGANATIVCGVEIGKYAFIGAGAVVTKDVKPFALIVGTPGKQAGWISRYGHKLLFDDTSTAICPESREVYKLENDEVKLINE